MSTITLALPISNSFHVCSTPFDFMFYSFTFLFLLHSKNNHCSLHALPSSATPDYSCKLINSFKQFKVDSEKVAKDKLTTPTKAGQADKQPPSTPTSSSNDIDKEKEKDKEKQLRSGEKGSFNKVNNNEDKNKKFKSGSKKRERLSDDEDRGLKRKSTKKTIKQEEEEGDVEGEGYGSGEWSDEENESGNESEDDSPANEYHLARDTFNAEDSTSNYDGDDHDDDESETGKRESGNGHPDSNGMVIDNDSSSKASSSDSHETTNANSPQNTTTKDKSSNVCHSHYWSIMRTHN